MKKIIKLKSPKVPARDSGSDHLGLFFCTTTGNGCKYWYEDTGDGDIDYEACKVMARKVTCCGSYKRCECPEKYKEA